MSGSTISTNAQLIRANIKLENDTHCFFIRELMNGAENAYDHITLFAQKYPVRVKFNEPDLKHLRQVIREIRDFISPTLLGKVIREKVIREIRLLGNRLLGKLATGY